MALALLFLAMLGAVADWRYVMAGGVQPTREETRHIGVTIALCVVALVALRLLGGSAEVLGQATALLGSLVFVLWEFGRFRVRRSHAIRP